MSLSQVPQLEVFPRAGPVGAYRPPEAQLGLLSCFLRDGWLVSWNEYSVYVLDWVNEVGENHRRSQMVLLGCLVRVVRLLSSFLQVLVGALESCGDIVSVSCCDNEIFVLKGDRDVIRLSDSPEGLTSDCEHAASPCWPPPALLSSYTHTNLDTPIPLSLSLCSVSALCAPGHAHFPPASGLSGNSSANQNHGHHRGRRD